MVGYFGKDGTGLIKQIFEYFLLPRDWAESVHDSVDINLCP